MRLAHETRDTSRIDDTGGVGHRRSVRRFGLFLPLTFVSVALAFLFGLCRRDALLRLFLFDARLRRTLRESTAQRLDFFLALLGHRRSGLAPATLVGFVDGILDHDDQFFEQAHGELLVRGLRLEA
jgi:hypothetical protein